MGTKHYTTGRVKDLVTGKYVYTYPNEEGQVFQSGDYSFSLPTYPDEKDSADCNIIYKNVAKSQTFTKNDCTDDTGSSYTYTVPAGRYTSNMSQSKADELAQSDIDTNGQVEANKNGTCGVITPPTVYSYQLIPGSTQQLACSGGDSSSICGPTDIGFAIDTTGSMNTAIDNVKTNLNQFADLVNERTAGNYRLSLVTFGYGTTVNLDFSYQNIEAFKTQVNALTSGGGVNTPEDSDKAVDAIVNSIGVSEFRPESTKIIILVTDAVPADGNDDYSQEDVDNVNRVINDAVAKGIKISSILTASADITYAGLPSLVQITKSWADGTGGVFIQDTTQGTQLYNGISSIMMNCGSTINYRTLYSTTSPLAIGAKLYKDNSLTQLADVDFYAEGVDNGDSLYEVNGTGDITNKTTCQWA